MLAYKDHWGRYEILELLGRIGDARAVPSLLRLLEDPKPGIREAAAKAESGSATSETVGGSVAGSPAATRDASAGGTGGITGKVSRGPGG